MTATLRAILTLSLIAAALVLTSPGAHAFVTEDRAGEPSVLVRMTALHESWQLRSVSGDTVSRRTFTQQLDVRGRSSGEGRWRADFSGAYTFDVARSGRTGDPLRDEHHLEPTLHVANATWHPWDPVRLTFGRQLLTSPIGMLRLDGLTASLSPATGPQTTLALGIRPQDTLWRPNDWSYQADGDPDLRGEIGASALVLEARGGWREQTFDAEVGVREERAVNGDSRYGQHIFAGTRVGRSSTPHARAHVRYHTLHRLLDDAALRLILPVTETTTIEGGALLRRPVFPLDSPFAIFPLSSHGDVHAGITQELPRGHEVGVELFVRSWSADERATPFVDAEGDLQAGGTLRHRYRATQGRWTWRSRAQTATEATSTRLTAHSALAWRTGTRGPDLQFSATGLYYADERRAEFPQGGAFHGSLGAIFEASPWAVLQAMCSAGLDSRRVGSMRLLLLADIHLPGAPR